MKVKSVILENFRIFKERTIIDFENLTAFIGKNDLGKSSILEALDIFFNENDAHVKIDNEDLSIGTDSADILIGVVFEDFPELLTIDSTIDSTFKTSLKEEYLLNKDGYLEIHRIYTNGKLKDTFIFANHPSNSDLEDLLILKIVELKKRAEKLGVDLSKLDKRVSSEIRKEIWNKFEKDIILEEMELRVDKEDSKKIWTKLKEYMPLYALFQSDRQNIDKDSEIQDPMNVAVKSIISESKIQEQLKKVQTEVEKAVNEIASQTIEKLSEMNPEIAKELKPIIPEPKWDSVFKGITISSDEGIPFNKRGSGVRRLILLNFFRAEADRKRSDRKVPNIIYAFEEPESSQHPDHQKKLIDAFLELSSNDDVQIILTTHSPGIAGLLPVESLRFLDKENSKVIVAKGTEDIYEKIAVNLGVLPSIDKDKTEQLKLVVCVEGSTDVDFFQNLSKILDEEITVDLENDNRVIIIPLGGSSLKHWVDNNYLRKLELPEVHIYDSDKSSVNRKIQYEESVKKVNNRGDGSKAFTTKKTEIENYVHPKVLEDIFHELKNQTLIDTSKSTWLDDWDSWDVTTKIKEKTTNLSQKTIKDKICTEGISKMNKDLFEELKAYDEIKEWFSTIKTIVDK